MESHSHIESGTQISSMQATSNAIEDENQAASDSLTNPRNLVFSKFPPELRVKIMGYIAPGPRRVKLEWDEKNQYFKTDAKPPINLAISGEWRIEFLNKYTLAFGTNSSPARIPVDFSRDQIYLADSLPQESHPTDIFELLTGASDFRQIRKLLIDGGLLGLRLNTIRNFQRTRLDIPLKSIIQVSGLKVLSLTLECQKHRKMGPLDITRMALMESVLELVMNYFQSIFGYGSLKALNSKEDLISRSLYATSKQDAAACRVLHHVLKEWEHITAFESEIPTFVAEMVSADGKKCPKCFALKVQKTQET